MRTALSTRLQKAEQAMRLVWTVQEWEALTDPATVEQQFQEAAEQIQLCTTAQEVFAVLHSLPVFDPDINSRCNQELIPLVPEWLQYACDELQEEQIRRDEIRQKVRRGLREGRIG